MEKTYKIGDEVTVKSNSKSISFPFFKFKNETSGNIIEIKGDKILVDFSKGRDVGDTPNSGYYKITDLVENKYAKGGLVGYKPLYLLFDNGREASIRFFLEDGLGYYTSVGDLVFGKYKEEYSLSSINMIISSDHNAPLKLKTMTKVVQYIRDKAHSYATIKEVLELLGGQELILADIGNGQTDILPKSYLGYHVFDVYEKDREGGVYTRVYAPNTLKAQKMLDEKLKSHGGGHKYMLQHTGYTVRNSRTDIQFGVGGNMEDKYYGGGFIDFGSNSSNYEIGGL